VSFLTGVALGVLVVNMFTTRRFSLVKWRREDSAVDYSNVGGVTKAVTVDSHTWMKREI